MKNHSDFHLTEMAVNGNEDRELVSIGRHVAAAVDLSREIAGKAAIFNATANLASALVIDIAG